MQRKLGSSLLARHNMAARAESLGPASIGRGISINGWSGLVIAGIAAGLAVSLPSDTWRLAGTALVATLALSLLGERPLLALMVVFSGVSLALLTEGERTLAGDLGGSTVDGIRLVAVVGAVGLLALRRPRLATSAFAILPFVGLLLLCALSLLWSGQRPSGLRMLFRLTYPLAAFLLATSVFHKSAERQLEKWLVLAGILSIVLNLTVLMAGVSLYESYGSRYHGSSHPNSIAMFSAMIAVAIVALSWGRKRALALSVAGLLFVQMLATGSRTSFLAAGVGLGLLLLLRRRFLLIGLLTLVGVGAWQAFPALSERSEGAGAIDEALLPTDNPIVRNFSGRILIWNDVWVSLVEGNAPWGRGAGTATELVSLHFPAIRGVHNGYLEILADLGVLGLGLFLLQFLVLASFFWRIAVTQPDLTPLAQAGLSAIVIFLTTAAADNAISAYSHFAVFPWLFAGVVIGYRVSTRADRMTVAEWIREGVLPRPQSGLRQRVLSQ